LSVLLDVVYLPTEKSIQIAMIAVDVTVMFITGIKRQLTNTIAVNIDTVGLFPLLVSMMVLRHK
jgi:hypothetical protein